VGAATAAKGSSYEALRGAHRLLLMEDPNELLLGATRSIAHTELLVGVPKQFLGDF